MRPDALELIRWADRLDCRARLPELIRRLVHTTTGDLLEVDFAAGEGIGRPGLDGRVRAGAGTAFVPEGVSVWEIGCSQDPAAKATADYKKRKAAVPVGVTPSNTTYVFVSPRRWVGRDQWAAERRREGVWKDVRAYDADSLEQWLELSPASSGWLAQLLGHPGDVQTLEDYFVEWSLRTSPPTPDALVLAGREQAQLECLNWLRGTPGVVSIAVPELGEAAAFTYACVRRVADRRARASWLDRAVVVRSDASLRAVGLEGRNQIIVALDCGIDVSRVAARSGHHVVCATTGKPIGERIELGALDRPSVAAVLEGLGIHPETAKKWSRETGGLTQAVRGRLGDRGSELPRALAPLLLVGSWSEANAADVRVVESIFGHDGVELQRVLRMHSVGPTAALQRSGTSWSWRSRLEAWRQLADALMPADLVRYADAVSSVLAIVDPGLELDVDERWMAQIKGKVLPHSGSLRRGLADAAAILASEAVSQEHVDIAASVVFRVLDVAKSWQQWASLDDVLPTLAEAAPSVFLREVRQLVEQHADTVRSLTESSGQSVLSWTDHLNGLVWGLETLAWHPDHLGESCELLMLIAEQEALSAKGGKRALRSLREILLPWLPHTTAQIDDRVATMRSIASRGGGVRFAFLVSLMPSFGGDSSTGTHKPAWREWLAQWKEGVTRGEVRAAHIAVWDLVLELAAADSDRWADVVGHLHELSQDVHLPKAIESLGALDAGAMTEASRRRLWTGLRDVLHRHRSIPEAGWAMPECDLKVLAALYGRIEPLDLEERFGWLFTQNPELPDFYGHDWRAEREAVAKAQAAAVRAITASSGIEAVLRVAATREAAVVGWAMAKGVDIDTCRVAVHASAAVAEAWSWRFRAGLAGGLSEDQGADVVKLLDGGTLPPAARGDLCLGMRFETTTWELLEGWGGEAKVEYWTKVVPFLRNNVDGELSRAVGELIAVGRAPDAIDLMGMHLHVFKETAGLRPQDIAQVLTAALTPGPGARKLGGMDVHHAAELMDILQDAGPEWDNELVKLEWAWFQALDHTRKPTMLHRALSENPEFFVQILSLVFRGDGDEPSEPDENASSRATNAYRLLNSWDRLPGTDSEGKVEASRLREWVVEVRGLAKAARRVAVADLKVGEALARSPAGDDGIWPHEAVRDLLESLGGIGDIRQGFVIGRQNQRGGFSKAIGEGGRQERSIAASYREAGDALRVRWPVVANFLREIADAYARDADHEDQRGARDKDAFLWAAGNEERLAKWLDALQAEGKYTFVAAEAASALGRTESESKQACMALVSRTRLVSPQDGFYVILPVEYRMEGCPPASWFIDSWMTWSGSAYAVGLLTSAALHGAAHQQPQAFQVLVPERREDFVLGRVRVQFVVDGRVSTLAASELETDTGTMRVLTPEETSLSLVQHAEQAGGADTVAGVLLELREKLDPGRLRDAASHAPTSTIQRLGYLLAAVGAQEQAGALHPVIERRDRAAVWLRSDAPVDEGVPASEPWLVAVERPVELDQ